MLLFYSNGKILFYFYYLRFMRPYFIIIIYYYLLLINYYFDEQWAEFISNFYLWAERRTGSGCSSDWLT